MKPEIEITGKAERVIMGERAMITGKDSRITSVVEKIISETDDKLVFETENTIYTLKKAA
ncbi:MAG: hypothetical protein K5768_06280 [Firmicutes bacterium]|nr:hypothetical protein [Bacillota bacterium]